MTEEIPYTPRAEDEAARADLAALLGKLYGTSAGGDDHLWSGADILISHGWRRAKPLFAEGGQSDGEYEYTSSSHCDGSHVVHHRRRPRMAYKSDYYPWEIFEPESDDAP